MSTYDPERSVTVVRYRESQKASCRGTFIAYPPLQRILGSTADVPL